MAKKDGVPSRANYKLEQIDQHFQNKTKGKFGLFQPGQTVIDLGAAPGGWTYYTSEKIGKSGNIVAVDLLNMDPSTIKAIQEKTNFYPIQGDFRSMQTQEMIRNQLLSRDSDLMDSQTIPIFHGTVADCIISDMAANFTGDSRTDALRALSLCEHALAFAIGSDCFDPTFLKSKVEKGNSISWKEIGLLQSGGTFVCKFFNCGQQHEHDLRHSIQKHFQYCTILKPKASRKESAEQYMIATGYLGNYVLQQLNDKRTASDAQ